MSNNFSPRVKICCIKNLGEAELGIRLGASALGLVSTMPSGPGIIKESTIKEIASYIPPGISSFLLTSLQDVDEIIAQHKRCGTNTIQICDKITKGSLSDLKLALPGISIVQVIHVTGEESIKEAKEAATFVNGLLLDSGNQEKAIKELGGTGRKHNWEISKSIVDSVNVPVYLAGGLNPENIVEAIRKVNPFGVDVCSGVRTSGNLDKEKLIRFMSNIKLNAES